MSSCIYKIFFLRNNFFKSKSNKSASKKFLRIKYDSLNALHFPVESKFTHSSDDNIIIQKSDNNYLNNFIFPVFSLTRAIKTETHKIIR